MADYDEVWRDMEGEAQRWYEGKRTKAGQVNTNVMTVGLLLAGYLADGVPMQPSSYQASSQVKGLSGERVRKILADHGEQRLFSSEGGRTSRGSLPLANELAGRLSDVAMRSDYLGLAPDEQARLRRGLQGLFVKKIQVEYFARQRLKAEIIPSRPIRVAVADLLAAAHGKGGNAAGAVAQHLVGAKLVLRFPGEEVENHSYTTADQQLGRPGDFFFGDTAFHVTTAPGEPLFRKCEQNIADGFRPFVLVPTGRVTGGQQIAETMGLGAKVAVQAVEDFVGTNVEEAGTFTSNGIRDRLRRLLEIYNERVEAVEPDPGLLIEIPNNL